MVNKTNKVSGDYIIQEKEGKGREIGRGRGSEESRWGWKEGRHWIISSHNNFYSKREAGIENDRRGLSLGKTSKEIFSKDN